MISACVIINSTGAGRFTITDTKLYFPDVTLSTQNNLKLLPKLKSGFERTINWNKYQSDSKTYAQKQYLCYFLYYLLKMKMIEQHIQNILSSKSRNKRL